jgi:hypothetical protein
MQSLLAILTVIIAAFVAYVGYIQFKLADEKFKLDLFEKRFNIYKSVESFLQDILKEANVTINRKTQLYKETEYAVFLFEDDIIRYLEELQKKASNFYVIHKKPLSKRSGSEHDKEAELLQWFADQITGENPKLIEIFSPYLKFKTWRYTTIGRSAAAIKLWARQAYSLKRKH